jgi:molybdate transport system substrate-binding protein
MARIIVALVLVALAAIRVDAAELKVLSSNGTAAIVAELGRQFEQATGHRLAVTYDTAVLLQKEIERGEAFDVAVLTTAVIDTLAQSGKIDATMRTAIARSGIGVAVRAGAPKPDIGTPEAFRQAMLSARSIAYTTVGGSGLHFIRVCERLGIADEVKAKGRTQPGGATGELVARGEADIAIQQISELLPVEGTDLVGPLPADLQLMTRFSAGVSAGARDAAAAAALIKFLSSPAAAGVIVSKGMEPG